MHARIDKSPAVLARSEEQRPEGAFQFADRRPEAEIHNRLQSLAQASPQAGQMKAIQARADTWVGRKGGPIQRFEGLDDEETAQGKFEPVQRLEGEDEEVAQGKWATVQREVDEEEPVQGRFQVAQRQEEAGSAKNETGLPDNLKSGIESLSGMCMDSVRVHYNSSQPAQLNALAYAQGTDIHVAPGQERHLPHEAWHVVQQAQGRVKPTMQMKEGVPVNDDAGLEHEADVMGNKGLGTGTELEQEYSESNSLEERPVQKVCNDIRTSCPPALNARVMQRMIGDGGIQNYGRVVIGPPKGRRFEVIGVSEFFGKLNYKLKDRGGNEKLVSFDDDNYELDQGYTGVFGFAMDDVPNTPIQFTVARRDNGARTNVKFSNPTEAIRVLTQECGLGQELAASLVERSDWTYPTMQNLMSVLQENDSLQPGLSEGASLWNDEQPAKVYTITTTKEGSQLAQIVGCLLMEFQETNNGTQGPKQREDVSRQQQLEFSEAILGLPSGQVELHTLGIGMPEFAKLFPAMFDVKFDDKKLFGNPAGKVMYKAYQDAVKRRREEFDHTDTLVDAARKNRKKSIRKSLGNKKFDFDDSEISKKRKKEEEDFAKSEFGLKDTESDFSMEEDESWEFPYTAEDVAKWSLKEFYDYVFKHNVYSGVYFKEYSSKLAELDILESEPKKNGVEEEIDRTRKRRKGVQGRIKKTNDKLFEIMKSLGFDVGLLYARIGQYKKKKKILDGLKTEDEEELKEISDLQYSLEAYIHMGLRDLKENDYKPPLDGMGDVALKALVKSEPVENEPAEKKPVKKKRARKPGKKVSVNNK